MTRRPLLLLVLLLVIAATPRSAQVIPSAGIPVLGEATPGLSGAPQGTLSGAPQTSSACPAVGDVSPLRCPSLVDEPGGLRHGRPSGAPLPSGGIGSPASYSKATPQPRIVLVRSGIASTYGPGWDGWIAWPDGPGWRLRVCGPGGCLTVVSTDAGPDKAMQRAPYNRVIDLDVFSFEYVCAQPWRMGLCPVSVQVLARSR